MTEEYDTDSVDVDLDIFVEYGVCNISLALNDDNIINQIIEEWNKSKSYFHFFYTNSHTFFIRLLFFLHSVDKGTFSVGIHWQYFGDRGYKDDDDEYSVKPRYNSFKEEMENYNYLPHVEINKILNKAKCYLQESAIAKSLVNVWYGPITLEQLICIIMYCDYSELSRDFTLSFRKRNEFELISQIKKRNQKYYHWSKILKNTIKRYGQSSKKGKELGKLLELKGPFYSGMSVVLNIPQFAMMIRCPLSTSTHIEVAVKFSGQKGMILEMDNSKGKCQSVKAMDCSWISRYKEEEERYVLCTNIMYTQFNIYT